MDELPPAVQKFIADVDNYVANIAKATAACDAFAKANDEAAAKVAADARAIGSAVGDIGTKYTEMASVADRALHALEEETYVLAGVVHALGEQLAAAGEAAAKLGAGLEGAAGAAKQASAADKDLSGANAGLATSAKTVEEAIAAASEAIRRYGEYQAVVVRTASETSAAIIQEAAAAKILSYADYQAVAAAADLTRANIEEAASFEAVRAAADAAREKILSYAAADHLAAAEETKLAIELASDAGATRLLSAARDELSAASAKATETFLLLGQAESFASEEAAKLTATATALRGALGADSGAAAAFAASMVAAGASARALTAAVATTGGGRGGGRWFGWLPATIAGMAAWHVILDLLIETLISVGEAALAAAAGIAVMAPTVHNLSDYLQSVSTVNSALGYQIPGLSAKFDALAKSMAPQTIEVYGGALSLVSNGLNSMKPLIEQVVTLFDDWIARIDLWAKNSGIMNKLLADGISFLKQFGSLLGYLGDAFKNLLAAMPGIAHLWLDVLIGGARVLDLFTKLPAPLLTAVLGLHGLYMMGRLLGGMLMWLGRQFGGLYSSLAKLATSPWGWAAVAAVALGYMAYQASHAQDAVTGLISSMEAKLSTETASQAIIQLATDIGILQNKINTLSLSEVSKQFGTFSLSVRGFQNWFQKLGYDFSAVWGHIVNAITAPAHGGSIVKVLGDIGAAIKGIFVSSASSVGFSRDMAAFNAEINKMLGSSRNLFAETGKLMKQGYSYSQALGLMDLAGVKWNDSLSLMAQKVQNVITGYQSMSISGGLLSNSVQAVTFATMQQDSKVQQLTQSWTAFFTTVSGGETGFVGFAQQAIGLYQAMATGGAALSESNGKVSSSIKALTGAGSGAKGSLTGLNTTSLNLRSTFLQSASAAQTEMNNLMTLASAAGLGARGTRMLTQAGKDMVATLLPAAKHSQALTTVLYALAQQAGYRGVNSFKALSQWVGHIAHPMQNLDKITTALTVAAGNLATDVKNLSTALGTTLNGAISKAIFMADGGQTAFDNYATALHDTGANSGTTATAAQALAQELTGLTRNASTAKREFEAMSIGMGMSRSAADRLWASVTKTATAAHTTSVAANDLSNRLAGMGNNAASAAARTGSAVDQKLAPLPAKLHAIGEQAVTAIGKAFTAGTGHVAGAAKSMADQAHGKVAAMAGQFRSAGAQASRGLATGILSNESAVVSAATRVANAATAALARAHQSASPSRLWRKYGFWAVQGLIQGLMDGGPKLMAAVRNLINSVNRAFQGGALTHHQDSSLVTWIRSDNAKLQALANQRKAIAAQIAAATAAQKSIQSSFGSIIGLGHAPAPLTAAQLAKIPTAQQMVSNLQTELGDLKRFAADLRKLKALGLDNAIIQRIVAMGPIQGAAYAEALISSATPPTGGAPNPGGPRGGTPPWGTGPPVATGVIAQLNSAYAQIESYTKSTSTSIANAMYDAGKQAGAGLAAGLKAQEKAIDKEMAQIARTLVDRIRKDLKIHSPSDVFREHGLSIDEGLAKGIRDGAPMVSAALHQVLAGLNPGGVMIHVPVAVGPVPGGTSGGGRVPLPRSPAGVNPGGPMQVHVHVELDGKELGSSVRQVTLRHAHRNWSSNLTLHGRGS